MAKPFLLIYPDKSTRHIGRSECARLLSSSQIEPTGNNSFAFTVPKSVHAFPDMKKLGFSKSMDGDPRSYLEGSFVFEHKGKRRRELLETADEMIRRMVSNGQLTPA